MGMNEYLLRIIQNFHSSVHTDWSFLNCYAVSFGKKLPLRSSTHGQEVDSF